MKNILRIIKTSWQLKPFYLGIASLVIVSSLLAQVSPLLIRFIVDELAEADAELINTGGITIAVGAIFLASVFNSAIQNLIGHLGDLLSVKLKRFLSNNYYQHLLKLPQKYFDNEHTGAIIARLNRSIDSITRFGQMFTNNFFSLITEIVLSMVVIAYFSWPVAVLLITLYPIYFFLTKRISVRWQAMQKKINDKMDAAGTRFAEVVQQIKVVKSFGREEDEYKHFNDIYGEIEDRTKPQSRMWHRHDFIRQLSQQVIFLAIMVIIIVQGVDGAITVGTVVLLIQYLNRARVPLFSMSFLVDNAQRAIADSRKYFEVMDLEEFDRKPAKQTKKISQASIRFKDVAFNYNKDETVLENLSFNVKKGEKVAIVGESGGGKSTVINLILGLYWPTSGKITIGGKDINTIDRQNLRDSIGIVFQDAELFSGTVKENIAYGKPQASLEEVEQAAKAANAHQFISQFKDGYDTLIGERGLRLSGGQKQRIAIARAIMKDPPILLLDEATSALDSKSELLVQDALDKLMSQRTSVIIAHRFSTIQSVDKIIVIDKGRMVEAGRPHDLAKKAGPYSRMLKLQKGDKKTRKQLLKRFAIVE